jgi:hypothetical protein
METDFFFKYSEIFWLVNHFSKLMLLIKNKWRVAIDEVMMMMSAFD